MERETQALFSKQILMEGARRFGVAADELAYIVAWQNFYTNITKTARLTSCGSRLRLREIIVYTGMYRSTDIAQLDQWGLDFITQSRARIESGTSIVDVWS